MSMRKNLRAVASKLPLGIVFGLAVSVLAAPSGIAPAAAAVPSIANWSAVDGTGIKTTGEGTPITATVTLGGTGTHPLFGTGTGASNYKFCAGINNAAFNYETYSPDDYVQVDFASAINDVKVLIGYVGPNDEMFISASTDGSNFTGVDLSDATNVSATAITDNTLATTLTSADAGYYAPSLTAGNYGGLYQVHFPTAIKSIRLANDGRNVIVGANTRNCVGLLIPGIIAYDVTAASSDVSMGSATASDSNSDGTWDLTATPTAGYNFTGWSCTASQTPADSTSATTTITPTADTSCTASFAVISTYTVTAGTGTGGTATATDDNSDGTWDLVATPSAGYVFSSWSCTGSQTPASSSAATTTITPTADTTCTPTFTAISVTPGSAKGSGTLDLDGVSGKFRFEISTERNKHTGVEKLKGSVEWQQKNLWKFNGKLDTYTVEGGVGTASGKGLLYFWKKSGRSGKWVAATSGPTFVTITFSTTGVGIVPVSNRASGSFGVTFSGTINPALDDELPSIERTNLSSGKIEMKMNQPV